jgi:hypothetical protein
MPTSARLLTSVSPEHHERVAQLAAEQGLSVSKFLARLVTKAVVEAPIEKMKRLARNAADEKAAAEKYTVRLLGLDAARLEERAHARSLTASGYAAHVLRAHLRANPPMPYKEFEELKRLVNALAGIHAALAKFATAESAQGAVNPTLNAATQERLLVAVSRARREVENVLIANSRSWGTHDA